MKFLNLDPETYEVYGKDMTQFITNTLNEISELGSWDLAVNGKDMKQFITNT